MTTTQLDIAIGQAVYARARAFTIHAAAVAKLMELTPFSGMNRRAQLESAVNAAELELDTAAAVEALLRKEEAALAAELEAADGHRMEALKEWTPKTEKVWVDPVGLAALDSFGSKKPEQAAIIKPITNKPVSKTK